MTSLSCPSCSEPLSHDARFCHHCGESAPAVTPAGYDRTDAAGLASAKALEHRPRLVQAIGTHYELGELIGRGGFGAVYRARDPRLDRPVAIKVLRPDFASPALAYRFDREAKAVAKLRHPNILPVYTVGEGDGIAYMVMPLVEGESLQARLLREGLLEPDEVARIVAETAAALEAAHKVGLVHRDVKPANIMLEGEERRVLLMDFGIAKAASSEDETITGTGVVVGSPAYMSPEQARGERDIDGRSDIYSLGAVAYEMLSGQLPFNADSLPQLVYKQVTQDAVSIAELVPGLPAPLGHAVMRSLEKEREHRWQTAADLRRSVSDADSALAGQGQRLEDEESWLSRRGPYLLVLGFLLYFTRLFSDLMFRPDLDRTGTSLLEYAVTVCSSCSWRPRSISDYGSLAALHAVSHQARLPASCSVSLIGGRRGIRAACVSRIACGTGCHFR